MEQAWVKIAETLKTADSIAFDGCHKIYVLMDACQTAGFKGYGYENLHKIKDVGEKKALKLLGEWYDSSCGLRFINGVRTVEGDPNNGFFDLIPQFSD